MRIHKPIAYLLFGLIGVPTPSFAALPVESPPVLAASGVESPPVLAALPVESPPRRLTDYDREVVWQDFHKYSQPRRMRACDLSRAGQRRFAARDAYRNGVPTRTAVIRYVKAYRVYVWNNC